MKNSLPRIMLFVVCSVIPAICLAQSDTGHIRSSPAYAEILLRKTELRSDLEAYLADYTETNPKLVDMRFELSSLEKETQRISAVPPSEASKLTLALGKLIVRKAAIATEFNRLNRAYSKEHPEVKRAAKKLDIFESAIKEILR